MKRKKDGAKEYERCIFDGKRCNNIGKLSVCGTCLHFMMIKGKNFIDYDCKFEIEDHIISNKIPLIEYTKTETYEKGRFKWGNIICTPKNPNGDRRIKYDYTDIGRCIWILDEKDISAGGHTGSLLEFAGILYDQNKNNFNILLNIHGPRTAKYIANDKSSFTNNGQFAVQIKDSGLYIETCLCANDCVELAYAMLEILGHDLNRLKVEKITMYNVHEVKINGRDFR